MGGSCRSGHHLEIAAHADVTRNDRSLQVGQFDRGSFNTFSTANTTVDGSSPAFASGTSCNFEASAIVS